MMSKNVVSIATMSLALAPLVSVLTAETAFAQAAQAGVQGSVTAPAPTTDTATPPPAADEKPKPLIWRGTSFTFGQAVTSTTIGIGRENIGGEAEYYGHEYTFSPRLYILDLDKDKIYASAEAGFAVELTNSDTTVSRNEPYFKDLQLGVTYARNLYRTDDSEWSTDTSVRGRFVFPTSPTSFNQGRYLTTSLGATIGQTFRLLGSEAKGLNNITITGGFTWSHLFSRATTPTNGDLDLPRQNASGSNINSDQLTGSSFDIDRFIPSLLIDLPLVGDLSLQTQFRIIGRRKAGFEGTNCDVVIMGECESRPGNPDAVRYHMGTTFDVALTQSFYDVVDVTIGYNSETLTVGEDGQARNIFYNPDTQFYVDITANIDVIYSKASGRDKQVASATPPSF